MPWEDEEEQTSGWVDSPIKAKKSREFGHPYVPKQGRPKGTYNPLVHAGKYMLEGASGLYQIPMGTDNPFSREVQSMADTYDKFDHPVLGQLGGIGLMALPEILAAPASIPATGIPFLGRTLAKQVGPQLARKKNLMYWPGVKGAVEGGVTGGAYHIDPDTESPLTQRAINAGMGFAVGAGLDALVTGGKKSLANMAAAAKRKAESGKLPKTVRLPGPELWNQASNAMSARAHRKAGSDLSWKPGAKTKELYESGSKHARDDIDFNANTLREQMTGLKTPVGKGSSIKDIVEELRIGKASNKDISRKAMDDFIDNPNNVLSVKVEEFYDIVDEFSQYMSRNIAASSHKEQLNKLTSAMNDMYDKVNGGFVDVKDLEKLMVPIRNVLDDTNPQGTAGQAATKLKYLLTEKLNNLKPGKNVFGSEKSFNNFTKAQNARKAYNETYNKNLLIREAADGELSPNEFSDRLFGSKYMADSAEKLDALDTIMKISPKNKKMLKREATQQLFSGQGSKGRKFNIEEFINEYGGSIDTGKGTPIFTKLFSKKELGKLGDLYNVSNKLENTYKSVSGLADTSLKAQAATLNAGPTMQSLIETPPFKQLGGDALQEYMRAARYELGHQYAAGNSLLAGKIGGAVGADIGNIKPTEDSPTAKNIKNIIKQLMGMEPDQSLHLSQVK